MLIEVNRTEEEGKKEYKVTPKVSVQENKAVTVDVSEYTEPVEILPPEGKVAMEKVTLTLDNIPSGELVYNDTIDYDTILPSGTEITVSHYKDSFGISHITADGIDELGYLVETSFPGYNVTFESYVGTLGSVIVVSAQFVAQE